MRTFEVYLPGMSCPTETVEGRHIQFENGSIIVRDDKDSISHIFPVGSAITERTIDEESILNQLKGIQEDIATAHRQVLKQGPLSHYSDGEMILMLKTIIDRVDQRCAAAEKLRFKSAEDSAGKTEKL